MTKKQRLKELRRFFREQVLKRDGYCCVFCDTCVDLDAHHITDRHDMPIDGYAISNGITLCSKHHLLAEKRAEGFSAKDLYEKIASSYEKAYEDCEKLGQ